MLCIHVVKKVIKAIKHKIYQQTKSVILPVDHALLGSLEVQEVQAYPLLHLSPVT